MWSFFQRHVAAGFGLLLGPAIYIGGLAMNAISLHQMGVPVEVWEIIGAGIFFFSVIGILIRAEQERLTHPALMAIPRAAHSAEIAEEAAPGTLTTAGQRIVIDINPKYIFDLIGDKISTEADRLTAPYIGKWITLSGKVKNVSVGQYSGKITTEEVDDYQIGFEFSPSWNERLNIITTGENILVRGKIYQIRRYRLELVECELR
jgi:hypothetical protein